MKCVCWTNQDIAKNTFVLVSEDNGKIYTFIPVIYLFYS